MSVPGEAARPDASLRSRLGKTFLVGLFPARADWLFLAGILALYVLFFWPGITGGHLLAPGDAQDYFLPMFLAPKTLWDPLLQNGYPLSADPQIMTWYPVLRLFALLGRAGWLWSWNAYILFCYIGAACSMYLYALSLAGKRIAAAAAAVVYTMSGFLISHLCHVTFLNAAIWIPGVLLGLEQSARRASWWWTAAAAACMAMMLLSGNPQLTVYTCMFCVARLAVLILERQARVWTACAELAGTVALAAGLAAVQLLPGAELQSLTPRAAIDYTTFSIYPLHPVELLTGLFPFILGSRGSPIYPQHYFGWSFVEGAFHIGFVALFLALAAFQLRPKLARFWGWAFVGVVLLASDTENALGPLLFRLPVYRLFRCHGRWMLFADLAAALLAAHGVAALAEGIAWRNALRLAGRFVAAIAAALFALFTLAPWIRERAAQAGFPDYHVSLQLNAVRIPLAVAFLGAAALLVWMRYPRSRVAQAAAACMLLASLASEARYDDWRTQPFTVADTQPPAALSGYAAEALAHGDSLLSLDPSGLPTYEGAPLDYTSVWRWPSLSFYHSLHIDRQADILALSDNGLFHGQTTLFMGPTPDVYGIRFVAVTPRPPSATISWNGLKLPDSRMDFAIGNAPGLPRFVSLPIPADAQKLLLVSMLGGSGTIRQGETVAEAVITFDAGRQAVIPVRAGIETAEHAHDCVDVLPYMKHSLAPVFDTHMAERAGAPCPEHTYIAMLDLGARETIREMLLRYANPAGALIVSRVWYVRPDGGVSANDITSGVTGAASHWRDRGLTPHGRVYENRRVLDRAWVTPAVRKMAPAEIRATINSGAFADGAPFDPRATALVETDVPGVSASAAASPPARIQTAQPSNTALEITVDSPARGFLVVRDIDYPGWHASRNGAEVPIYRANYIQRGVVVEPGANHIRFEYTPNSFRLGAAVSLATLLVMVLISLRRVF